MPSPRHILVLGASGYVGGRLVPELVRGGHHVRCLTRSADCLGDAPWADAVEIVAGDVLEPATLTPAMAGVDTVVYLGRRTGAGDR